MVLWREEVLLKGSCIHDKFATTGYMATDSKNSGAHYRLIIIANILLFPYSTSTPPDALEIARLSGREDRMRPIY
jgi:hypothetical protein